MKRLTSLCAVTAMLFGLAVPAAVGSTQAFRPGLLIRPYETTGAALTSALDAARSAGVRAVNAPVRWSDIAGNAAATTPAWAPLDQLVSGAAKRGITVSVQLMGTPAWVHPAVAIVPGDTSWYPPVGTTQIAQWTQFVSSVVSRYGTRLTAYQIWNEPNDANFWEPAPSPADYATLLRSSYLAAKQVNSGIQIEFGGLSGNDAGYLSSFYQAAATAFSDSAANHWFFDRMNVHPYTANRLPDEPDAGDADFAGLDQIRQVMAAAHDTGKHIRIGEYGASTTTTWMPAVTDQFRALMLKRALTLAAAMGDVDELDWYAYVPNAEDTAAWTIVSHTMLPSATFTALKQWLGPPTTVTASVPTTATGPTTVTSAISGSTVAGTDVYADGKLVATGPGPSVVWDTRQVVSGPHQILVVARTADGSVWTAPVQQVTISNPPVNITSASLGIVPTVVTSGSPFALAPTLTGSTIGVMPAVVVAVRDAAGGSHDFPMEQNVLVTPAGVTLAAVGTLPSAGVYQLWLAAYNGQYWQDLGPASLVSAT